MPGVGGTHFHGGGATVNTTQHISGNDARRVLYILMAGAEGGGPSTG